MTDKDLAAAIAAIDERMRLTAAGFDAVQHPKPIWPKMALAFGVYSMCFAAGAIFELYLKARCAG